MTEWATHFAVAIDRLWGPSPSARLGMTTRYFPPSINSANCEKK